MREVNEMLQRKIEKNIIDWLEKSDKALLIEGARQVGKTFIIRKTLSDQKINFFEFNLISNPEIIELFKNYGKDIDQFIHYLSFISGKRIEKGSVIFFDEVQECKEMVTYIKFFQERKNYKFILSGSLLGVELTNLKSAPVGYLEILKMYPLDFEEFSLNQGVPSSILEELENCFRNKKPVDKSVNEKMFQVFRNYLIVGGMPDAVNVYVESQDFEEVEKIHKNLIELYKKDFSKYDESEKLKLMKIYDLIPSELNSQNKRFVFSNLENNGRFNKYENSFNWLIDSGVALATFNTKEPRLPLKLNMDNSSFKFFMSDVGLLTSCYGKSTKIAILVNDNSVNAGAIYENFVAQELKAHGYDLFYFNNRRIGELDFVIEYNEKALPIEVKSGKDYKKHSALNNCFNNNVYKINKAIVFANNNVEDIGKITYYPIYMAMFIKEPNLKDIKLNKVKF